MLLFFEKKSNQIKTKNISSERVEVQRAETNDTLKHPAYISMSFYHGYCPSF